MERTSETIKNLENGTNSPLLVIEDLVTEYRTERATIHALNGVNLTINRGESLGLVGESGAGKTTTALSILNLLPMESARILQGDIRFNGDLYLRCQLKSLLTCAATKWP